MVVAVPEYQDQIKSRSKTLATMRKCRNMQTSMLSIRKTTPRSRQITSGFPRSRSIGSKSRHGAFLIRQIHFDYAPFCHVIVDHRSTTRQVTTYQQRVQVASCGGSCVRNGESREFVVGILGGYTGVATLSFRTRVCVFPPSPPFASCPPPRHDIQSSSSSSSSPTSILITIDSLDNHNTDNNSKTTTQTWVSTSTLSCQSSRCRRHHSLDS